MCRNQVWHTCFIPCIKTWKTKTTKLRKKRSTQLLRECWSFLTKLMTCQNLQNKMFIWYLLASLNKMSLAKHGELYFILATTCFSPLTIFTSVWKKWFPTLRQLWQKSINWEKNKKKNLTNTYVQLSIQNDKNPSWGYAVAYTIYTCTTLSI